MKKAFTLIEILTVIIIIGIITTLVIPITMGIIEDTKQSVYDNQIISIQTAAKGYITENGSSIPALDVTSGTYTLTLNDLVTGGYIESPIKNQLTNSNMNLDTTTILVTKLANGTYSYEVTVN